MTDCENQESLAPLEPCISETVEPGEVHPAHGQKIMLEWGHDDDSSAFSMRLSVGPNAEFGQIRINFSLDEIRSLRNSVIELIDRHTQYAGK